MQRAEYPQKLCREGIFGPFDQGYTCELPLLHPGPCASFSLKESVEQRDQWEERHPNWRDRIGQMDDIV